MAFSKIEIQQYIANLLGKKIFTSIETAGEFGPVLELAYNINLKVALSQNWRFATKLMQLNALPEPPILNLWAVALQLPGDYLSAWTIYPNQAYTIYGDQLWANSNNIILEYRFQPSETQFPDYFVNYLANLTASKMAYTVTKDAQLVAQLRQDAVSAMQTALFIDAQSRPVQGILSNPFIDVRSYGAPVPTGVSDTII